MAGTLSLRAALDQARRGGATVAKLHGTGEVSVLHREISPKPLRINDRKKDAPMILHVFLKKLDARNGGR